MPVQGTESPLKYIYPSFDITIDEIVEFFDIIELDKYKFVNQVPYNNQNLPEHKNMEIYDKLLSQEATEILVNNLLSENKMSFFPLVLGIVIIKDGELMLTNLLHTMSCSQRFSSDTV